MSFLSEVARPSAALNRASSMAQLSTDLRVPKVVITGGQSAGKSSLMNSLLGIDLLPTVAEMCTRVPLALGRCAAGWSANQRFISLRPTVSSP